MIDQYARRTRADFALNEFAVDSDLIGREYALADMCRLTIDRNASCDDQLFHVTARAETGLGQHLVQLGCIVFGGEVTT